MEDWSEGRLCYMGQVKGIKCARDEYLKKFAPRDCTCASANMVGLRDEMSWDS